MDFIKQIERIKKIHYLISSEKTGPPCVFAEKMHLSRRQLYNVLDIIKNFNAPLKYCKKRESFYYELPFDLELNCSLKIIVDEEIREIYGGFHFRASLLHGSLLTL